MPWPRQRNAPTEKEAKKLLRQLLAQRDDGTLATGRLTLSQFVPQYLEAVRVRNVRPRTIEAYREKLDKHIVPALGHIRLAKLTSAQVEKLYGEKLDAGLSPSTVGMIHQVLNQLLRMAKRRGLVGRIVTQDVDPPKRKKFQARALTLVEARALLAAIRDHRHGPLWTFMLASGVRFGEAVGLAWGDVDLDDGIVTIRQAVTRYRQDGHVRLAIDRTKTEAGNRQLPLPSWAVEALKSQRAKVPELRLLAGPSWADQDLVVVQRTLGHARQSITADLYVGKVPKAMRTAADRYGERLAPTSDKTG